ncbi:DNA helicase [Philodulcilactobacillus myokoensis]|uniref:DNA helicase n=1 Tax=Philodulcilactobacillus myokoensis TaxID=2929573 RepID=A0A9W6ESX4_9LACO|nr:RNA polymerase recycling motor HelD [Philodulcilactobacillus myokoensis]GLB47240.1 DNA helicase [Philodulcilactobacillus myokoensis]
MDANSYQAEQQRVNRIIDQLNNKINKTKRDYQKANQELKNVQQNYVSNTSINLSETDDLMESRAEIQQQRALASRDIESASIIKKQLNTYQTLKKSPYFGRIDIQDADEDTPEKLYIGTASLIDNDQHFLIFDWRAPIASVYYNGVLGQVAYDTPAGHQSTNLKRKRQFLIRNGKIDNMFDTNETVGDKMLQYELGQKNDQVMHNIVSTIQKKQNTIIRDTDHDLLVVQGAAGSGKTSAILQRIAFLMYHSRDSLNVSQIVLFSPNRLFSHYISDVLPSLGEKNMRQVTLSEFLSYRFEGLDVQNVFDRYETENKLSDDEIAVRNFKNGLDFMKQIKNYCSNLTSDQLAFNNILFDGRIFFSKNEIHNIYRQLPMAMMPADKFLKTKNALIKLLKRRIKIEAKKDWAAKEVDSLSSTQVEQILLKAHRKFLSEDDERSFVTNKLVKERLRIVYDAIYNDDFFDPYVQYLRFLKNGVNLPKNITESAWKVANHKFNQKLELHQLLLDDAVPLLYLRNIMCGDGINHDIKYLFVDEMQDYSIAQLLYLKFAFPNAKLNLIGDSEQALFKNVENPQTALNKLKRAFNSSHAKLITLNRSYRSTYPITTFAKSLLPDGKNIQAFHRPGNVPKIIIRPNSNSAIKTLIEQINKMLKHQETVAIITKNLSETKMVYSYIRPQMKATILSNTDRSLPKGVLILPVYLAKGLEFDGVIAWDVSENNYNQSQLLGILYTIATRAMHELTLLSVGPVSSLITHSHINSHEIKIDRKLNEK